MALTETRPETDAPTASPQASTATIDGILGSADHKTIGRLWIGAGLLMLVAGCVVSFLAGLEAIDLGSYSVVADADEFTQLWSLGRDLLLFGAIAPILVGLGIHLVPLQIGAPAVAFARGASGAFWTWFLATDLLVLAYILNGGPGGGRADFVVLWAVALGAMALAIGWALVIIATTILGARTVGMSLDRVPFTTWSYFVFSLIGLMAIPVLVAEIVLVYVRIRHGFVPIDARQALTGVVDASNLPPGLYWVGIPLLGMAADIIGVHTATPSRRHRSVMIAIAAFGVLTYGADFLGFASVRPLALDNGLLVVTIAAAPLAVLAVLGLVGESLRKGTPRFTTALVGALVSGVVLLLAAAVSILGLIEPVALFFDKNGPFSPDLTRLLILNGTTFHDGVRGLVLGAAVVAIIAALHHWSPKLWGRHMAESLGLLSVLAAAGGAVLWGAGAVLAGIDDQPAYPASTLGGGDTVEFFNVIAMIGLALLAGAAALTALGALRAAMGQSTARSGEGWTGTTLEWATSSPPSPGNFDKPPVVRSATPLADSLDAIDESEVILDDAARAGASAAEGEEASS